MPTGGGIALVGNRMTCPDDQRSLGPSVTPGDLRCTESNFMCDAGNASVQWSSTTHKCLIDTSDSVAVVP